MLAPAAISETSTDASSVSFVRALVDESVYREKQNNKFFNDHNGSSPHWDPQYSGWSNASRPKDYPIFLRPITRFNGG